MPCNVCIYQSYNKIHYAHLRCIPYIFKYREAYGVFGREEKHEVDIWFGIWRGLSQIFHFTFIIMITL